MQQDKNIGWKAVNFCNWLLRDFFKVNWNLQNHKNIWKLKILWQSNLLIYPWSSYLLEIKKKKREKHWYSGISILFLTTMYFTKNYKNLFVCAVSVVISPQEMANIPLLNLYQFNKHDTESIWCFLYLRQLEKSHFPFARLESGRGKES